MEIGESPHRVGRTRLGYACILIEASERSRLTPLPMRLELLTVSFDVECTLTSAGLNNNDRGHFTVLTCLSLEPAIIDYFFAACWSILARLGTNPTSQRVSSEIRHLTRLFASLKLPARKTVQGIWAELFLIDLSDQPEKLAAAWHSTSTERWDFSAGRERLEVKSAAGRLRQHHFSLEQLEPPFQADLVVCSMLLERSAGGLTLEALLESVQTKLPADSFDRVLAVVSDAIGIELTRNQVEGYDREFAEESIRYYRSTEIPRISRPLPTGVSNVQFIADLSMTSALGNENLTGAFFGAFPRQLG
jgi:hypothetical protein